MTKRFNCSICDVCGMELLKNKMLCDCVESCVNEEICEIREIVIKQKLNDR